ncbi:hypothetical protein DOY81_000883, partial [Sarcophaga bullata]
FHYYDFNIQVNKRFYANASAATNVFRFRDFEPRKTIKTVTEIQPITFDGLVRDIRKPRGFQFHADDRDFNVELEFIIPFVRIPIERSTSVAQTAFRSLFNLNLQSLFTTGAIVAIGGIFAIILKSIFTPFAYVNDYKKVSRNEESFASVNDNQVNQFINLMDTKLEENNINLSHCIQRSLCTYVQEKFVKHGSKVGGAYQIVDGILSLQFVRNYLKGTAIQNALETAQNEHDCLEAYNGCNWIYSKNNLL